jgi:hypothetical protein
LIVPILSPVVNPHDPSIDLCIDLREGYCSSNAHPMYNFLSYHRLSLSHHAFVSFVSIISIYITAKEALSNLGW